MRVLITASGNSGHISPFVKEQAEAIYELGDEIEIYPIVGKGILGYLNNLKKIKKKIKEFSPDLLHAHYGLTGLVSSLQRTVPVIITFHGSDAYIPYVRLLSKIAALLSVYNIFVSEKIKIRIKGHRNNAIIPCGINFENFYPMNKKAAREMIGLNENKKYILFSSRFDNPVKNYTLAKKAVDNFNEEIEIIELKNRSRHEVNLLINACDLMLLTSYTEGSPQVIKEAMACNCPIVATDVGDIKEIIGNTAGCYLVSFKNKDKSKRTQSELIEETSQKIEGALKFAEKVGRTNGRERIIELGLDSESVAKRIIAVYHKVTANSR